MRIFLSIKFTHTHTHIRFTQLFISNKIISVTHAIKNKLEIDLFISSHMTNIDKYKYKYREENIFVSRVPVSITAYLPLTRRETHVRV